VNKINVAVASEEQLQSDDVLGRMIFEDDSLQYVGTVSGEKELEDLMKVSPPDIILFRSIVPKLWRRNGRLFFGGQNVGGTKYVIPGTVLPLREENLELIVNNIFHELGIPSHISGFQFLRDAVVLTVYDREMIRNITKVLYPTVARKNMTTASRVERAIRHAIDTAWERGNMSRINELFGYTVNEENSKPSNREFIALISDKIRTDWKNRRY